MIGCKLPNRLPDTKAGVHADPIRGVIWCIHGHFVLPARKESDRKETSVGKSTQNMLTISTSFSMYQILYFFFFLFQGIYTLLGFPGNSAAKESICNAGDPGLIPGLGRSPGGEIGYPLQYSWASLVTQLVKNPSAIRERPGFSPWVGKIPWRRERLHTLVFWPREFYGLYSPWGRKESDTTE